MTSTPHGTVDGMGGEENEERALILAPVGRDAALIEQALKRAAIGARVCSSLADACRELSRGAAALVLTTESLDGENVEILRRILGRQPAWSDLPLVVLAASAAVPDSMLVLQESANVTILERPLRLSSLVSTVQSSIRARRRQYEVRSLLAQKDQARAEAERQQAEISELNRRLQQSMRETHHRVKNNLQLITAMLDMHVLAGRKEVPISEIERLDRSIRALAAIHDILTRSTHSDSHAQVVSARAVLEALLPMHQQMASGRTLRFHADDAQLSTRQSSSLAIVVNELVSNAMKHGRGVVDVRYQVFGRSAKLAVCDNGPGFPGDFDPRREASTGLDLVVHLVRWDLDGDVTFTTHPGGGARVEVVIRKIGEKGREAGQPANSNRGGRALEPAN